MSGFCGWYSASDNYSSDELEAMGRHLAVAPRSKIQNHGLDQLAVSTCSAAKLASFHATPEIAAIITGNPVWLDPESTHISKQANDAVALADAYKKYGDNFIQHVHGSFAIVLLDRTEEKTFLALDRVGIEHLCFAQCGQTLLFATHVLSLSAHSAVSPTIDPQGLYDYLYFHMVPAPGSILKNVSKLLPGELLKFQNNQIQKHFYWTQDYPVDFSPSLGERVDEFHQVLKESICRATASGEKVGAFLSGGTDSSTMTAALARISGSPVDTFSIGFDAEGYDETEYAEITAARFNTNHRALYVTPEDVVEAIPLISKAYDEPFGNASAIPTYYCAKSAMEYGIESMIAGDGGDEVFAGNKRYLKQKQFNLYFSLPRFVRKSLIEPILLQGYSDSIAPVRKLKSYVQQANVPLPDRLETYNFLHRAPLNTMFHPDFLGSVNENQPMDLIRREYARAQTDSDLNRMLFLDSKLTLADNDLRKVNQMCELAGINVQYPLLDEEMLKFASKIPPGLKIRGQRLRYFFKYALRETLAPETLNKSKHGFGLPFGVWMKEYKPLHDLAHDSLASLKSRRILNDAYIDRLLQQHDSEHSSYYGVMIWVLMMLEQWLAAHKF